ncbi:MAG: exonuclease domain-containing protein [Bacteroidales bacterium]
MELKLSRPLAIFDLETTGVNVGTDRIVEICIIRANVNGTTDMKTMLINPTIPIPAEATAIHHITNEDVKDKPTFIQVANELNQFLHNCDLAGFNSNKFDIPLLVEEFLRADVDFDLKNRRFVDVMNIFHKMEPRNLSAAYKFYCNDSLENAHSAEADTIATYKILKAQLDKYENAEYKDFNGKVFIPVVNDVKALHDFSYHNKNADLAGHIIFDDKNVEIFNFGKNKGKSVEAVFKAEPSYYDWMMKSQFPLMTKKVITAIKLRGFNNNAVNINS